MNDYSIQECTEWCGNMRPWCKYAECFTPDCRNCADCGYQDSVVMVPEWETVAQWEARTGRIYPDTAPVYVAGRSAIGKIAHPWVLRNYTYKGGAYKATAYIIVATEAGAPPNDWRPL